MIDVTVLSSISFGYVSFLIEEDVVFRVNLNGKYFLRRPKGHIGDHYQLR